MSLDTVELVMKVEETFDITIPDEEAEKILTVGDLYRYILARVDLAADSGCLSSARFYQLRRVFVESFGVARERVRPAASVEELVPRELRREHWSWLGETLGLRMPALERPESFRRAFHSIILIWPLSVFLATLGTLWIRPDLTDAAFFGLLVLVPIALQVAFLFTRPLAVELPRHCRTVRGLVEALVGEDLPREIPAERKWSRATVWEAIRAIVVAQAGVSPDLVRDETSFVYDLGLD